MEILRRGQTTRVICTDLENPPGTSVPNFAEHPATQVCPDDATLDR